MWLLSKCNLPGLNCNGHDGFLAGESDSGAGTAVVLTTLTSLSGLWQQVHLDLILLLIIKDIFRLLQRHTFKPDFNQNIRFPEIWRVLFRKLQVSDGLLFQHSVKQGED
ncbi:hypothetical protein XENOCAPTIV_010540 [Xenoophorus captivus]|uniref:Uncharacterized protein n=1 Tax=Xenoophorus captivus TaxID=1517983 RepID=A0ABV0SFA1_9TELE